MLMHETTRTNLVTTNTSMLEAHQNHCVSELLDGLAHDLGTARRSYASTAAQLTTTEQENHALRLQLVRAQTMFHHLRDELVSCLDQRRSMLSFIDAVQGMDSHVSTLFQSACLHHSETVQQQATTGRQAIDQLTKSQDTVADLARRLAFSEAQCCEQRKLIARIGFQRLVAEKPGKHIHDLEQKLHEVSSISQRQIGILEDANREILFHRCVHVCVCVRARAPVCV